MLEGSSFYFYVIAFVVLGSIMMVCRRRQQQIEQQQAVIPMTGGQTMAYYPQGGVPNAYLAPPATGYTTAQPFAPVQQVPYSGGAPATYFSHQQNEIQPVYAVAVPLPNSSAAGVSTAHVQAVYIR